MYLYCKKCKRKRIRKASKYAFTFLKCDYCKVVYHGMRSYEYDTPEYDGLHYRQYENEVKQ